MAKKIKKFKNKGTKLRVLDIFLNVSFVLMVLGFVIMLVLTLQLPKLDFDKMVYPVDSYVYDSESKLVGTISRKEENQQNIKYDDMNQSVINTLVGTEDATFFTHQGLDIINTTENGLKAIFAKGEAGGSSITQQLIGQVFLDRNDADKPMLERVSRKAQEILLSVQAENQSTKTELIETYWNYIYLAGPNVNGIEKASNYYFDRHASSLTQVDAIILTGTLNAPNFYNPLSGKSKDGVYLPQKRYSNVLQAVKNQGYIGLDEYKLLSQVKIEDTVKINENSGNKNDYQAFIDAVVVELQTKYNVNPRETSMQIYTTMDRKLQDYANEINQGEIVAYPEKNMNMGFILTKTQTGEIQALGGGTQYNKSGSYLFNNATQNLQQPGSAFKPVIDYAPTFEYLKWGDRAPISNDKYVYPGTNIQVRNYDGKQGGVLTMDSALATSRNLTALRALDAVAAEIGYDGIAKYLKKQNFSQVGDTVDGSAGLGTIAVTPKELAGAYATFGNKGMYIEPFTVKYFVDTDGVKTENKTEATRVMEETTAFMMSTSLERSTKTSAFTSNAGYNKSAYAAKTGTSNHGAESAQYGIPNLAARDSWYTGYTTEYTATVWTGYDAEYVKKGKYIYTSAQHNFAARIWGSLMNKASNGKEQSWLAMDLPEGIVKATFDPNVPAPFKKPGLGQKSATGYFFSSNLPSGTSDPKLSTTDFVLSVDATTGGANITYKAYADVPEVKYLYKVNGKEYTATVTPQNVKLKNKDTIIAYYSYNDKQYGTISKCYYENKLYNTCNDIPK